MEFDLEKLVTLITKAVVDELNGRGANNTVSPQNSANQDQFYGLSVESKKIDMSKYRTPIVTENHIDKLNELVGIIVVPKGTIFTPKAKEKIKQKNLKIKYEM